MGINAQSLKLVGQQVHWYNLSFAINIQMSQLTEELVLNSLRTIIDPDLRKDIVTLGFVRDLKIEGGDGSFRVVLTTPACPVKEEMEGMARESVRVLPGVASVNVT